MQLSSRFCSHPPRRSPFNTTSLLPDYSSTRLRVLRCTITPGVRPTVASHPPAAESNPAVLHLPTCLTEPCPMGLCSEPGAGQCCQGNCTEEGLHSGPTGTGLGACSGRRRVPHPWHAPHQVSRGGKRCVLHTGVPDLGMIPLEAQSASWWDFSKRGLHQTCAAAVHA